MSKSRLRLPQRAVMEDLLTFFESEGNGYVRIPTGGGKTVIFSELLKAMRPTRTLIAVPTKQLLEQTAHELGLAGVDDVSIVSPGNDEMRRGAVSVVTHASLVKHGRTYGGKYYIDPDAYDIVIVDEAHHATAEGMREVLQKFQNARIVGFTATPNYSDDPHKKLDSILPYHIHEMSIAEAIDMGVVAPFSNIVLNMGGDMSSVKVTESGDYDTEALLEVVDEDIRTQRLAKIFAETLAHKKAVFSCAGVEHAQHTAEALRGQGISARAVYGGLPKNEIEEIFQNFYDKKLTVLCNNKILSEGFDDPNIEVVVNVAPTRSQVRQPQRVGRGMRIDPANPHKELLVIDCLDANYRAMPFLMSDDRLAGITGLPPRGDETRALIDRIQSRAHAHGIAVCATHEELMALPRAVSLRYYEPKVDRLPTGARQERRAYHRTSSHRDTTLAAFAMREALSWQNNALCAQVDTELFFPEKGGSAREAKKICMGCEVRSECLDYALRNGEHFGIWGGLAERERRKIALGET